MEAFFHGVLWKGHSAVQIWQFERETKNENEKRRGQNQGLVLTGGWEISMQRDLSACNLGKTQKTANMKSCEDSSFVCCGYSTENSKPFHFSQCEESRCKNVHRPYIWRFRPLTLQQSAPKEKDDFVAVFVHLPIVQIYSEFHITFVAGIQLEMHQTLQPGHTVCLLMFQTPCLKIKLNKWNKAMIKISSNKRQGQLGLGSYLLFFLSPSPPPFCKDPF